MQQSERTLKGNEKYHCFEASDSNDNREAQIPITLSDKINLLSS